MQFSYAVSSIPNSSLERTKRIRFYVRNEKSLSCGEIYDVIYAFFEIWRLAKNVYCASGIFSQYILHHVIAETYRAIKLKAYWNLCVKRARNNICFNGKSQLQILLRILTLFVKNSHFTPPWFILLQGRYISIHIQSNRKLQLTMLTGNFFPRSTNDLVNHSIFEAVCSSSLRIFVKDRALEVTAFIFENAVTRDQLLSFMVRKWLL